MNNKKPFEKAGFEDWLSYVEGYVELIRQGKNIPFKQLSSQKVYSPNPSAAKMVICSPHPDDETLTGLLPLRLLQESGLDVVNLAVTLGSDPKRKNKRQNELQAACSVLGFRCDMFKGPPDFNEITSQNISANTGDWQQQVKKMVTFFDQEQPDMVICPHADDGHPTHEGTNQLVLQSLLQHSTVNKKEIFFVESEYWHPLKNPNVLVGANAEHVARLVTALTQHRDEMSRMPYHLHLPARMLDNVRRGVELISGYGKSGTGFLFGELYRLSRIKSGKQISVLEEKQILGPDVGLSLSVFKGRQTE